MKTKDRASPPGLVCGPQTPLTSVSSALQVPCPSPRPLSGRPLAGILFLLAASVLLPLMDGCAKLLSQRLSVFEITWARYTVHWVLLLPLLSPAMAGRPSAPAHLGMQLARSTTLLVGTVLFFFGLAYMPIADTLALFFVSPLIATALSPWILGEKVGRRRYAAVLIGFIGALIIFRPGIGVFRWPALFPFASGLLLRLLRALDPPARGLRRPLDHRRLHRLGRRASPPR